MRSGKPQGYKKHLVDGRWMSAARAAELAGLSPTTIYNRMHRGMTLEEALAFKCDKGKQYTWRGETHTLKGWSEITGISIYALRKRLDYGWPLDRALTQPARFRRIEGFGKAHTVPEWARLIGYTKSHVYNCLRMGKTIEQIADGTAYGKIQDDKANPGNDPGGGAV